MLEISLSVPLKLGPRPRCSIPPQHNLSVCQHISRTERLLLLDLNPCHRTVSDPALSPRRQVTRRWQPHTEKFHTDPRFCLSNKIHFSKYKTATTHKRTARESLFTMGNQHTTNQTSFNKTTMTEPTLQSNQNTNFCHYLWYKPILRMRRH